MREKDMPITGIRRINGVWLVLVAATLITYGLGESGASGRMGMRATLLMFSLTLVKGYLIAQDYMGLRRSPLMWRLLILGWLLVVTVFIIGAYAVGLIAR